MQFFRHLHGDIHFRILSSTPLEDQEVENGSTDRKPKIQSDIWPTFRLTWLCYLNHNPDKVYTLDSLEVCTVRHFMYREVQEQRRAYGQDSGKILG